MSPIPGAERLTVIFGAWPTFHDAEVVRLVLDRADATGRDHAGPTLTLSVRVFSFGPEVAPNGTYVLHDETLATLRFDGVVELELEGFNQQNALAYLRIDDARERQLEQFAYEVTLAASYGIGARFVCATAEVVDAEAWHSEGGVSREG